MKNGRDQWN